MTPKVSILTPTFNATAEQYNVSLDSINKQTVKDFEWIVVDDGSTEPITFPIDAATTFNYGPSVARNIAFQLSSGNVVTYLDMGDELSPFRVETLIRMFTTYKIKMLFSGYYINYPDGRKDVFNPFRWIGSAMSVIDYAKTLEKQNISIPMGVAHTRSPFVLAGGFQRGIVCGEDGVLWRRMISNVLSSEVLFTDDITGTYFVSEDGQSRTQRRFDMGGFAIQGDLKDNGKYLDETWYKNFTSEDWYE